MIEQFLEPCMYDIILIFRQSHKTIGKNSERVWQQDNIGMGPQKESKRMAKVYLKDIEQKDKFDDLYFCIR